jgi:hypothetical protein
VIKLPIESFRQSVKPLEKGDKRRHVRSCPRLESLEGRTLLSSFRVNTTLDTVAVSLQTGKDATGHISLRSAIMAADATAGSSTITLPKGTFKLTLAGANEDASATGDLDITNSLTIKGVSSRKTIIDGENLDRVFEIHKGNVSISGVTIQHGLASVGGGLLNSGGQVSLSSVAVLQNRAIGGAIAQESNATGAAINGTNGMGGGIYNASGSVSISNSTIAGNQAQGSDGGRGHDGEFSRTPTQPGSTVFGGRGGDGGNGYFGLGGGIYNAKGATLKLSGTVLSSNIAKGGNGGSGGSGGNGTGLLTGLLNDPRPADGGEGEGGVGGAGGTGGSAAGGGLFNAGSVLLEGRSNTISSNIAVGGAGGTGGLGGDGFGSAGGNSAAGSKLAGGTGGVGDGAQGGSGGAAGSAAGGGVLNTQGGMISSTSSIKVLANQANGGRSGNGGNGGAGTGGVGGIGDQSGAGGTGGSAISDCGGQPFQRGGSGRGGGIYNDIGATIVFRPKNNHANTPASLFSGNQANGGAGGDGGEPSTATGGLGGKGGVTGKGGNGGDAGDGGAGFGAVGGGGGDGMGGGLLNAGTASFTGITVNFKGNQANGGAGGHGRAGEISLGGKGGDGTQGGNGGGSDGGSAGHGGNGGNGSGGGVWAGSTGNLTLAPRMGVTKGSKQFRATNSITANQANRGTGGAGGPIGGATIGKGGSPNGSPGANFFAGIAGVDGASGSISGGGVVSIPGSVATFVNTKIKGNGTTSSDNDVSDH